ncbi:MAG: prolipoprotein diacylglyceryl transferase [Deferrisomatales bacterium]|nr:prolipoprotein diacylglyceryl transferase [Deferrisomatales bacterium]
MNLPLTITPNFAFLGVLTAALTALLGWAFARLPREHWQIVATLPRRKGSNGTWEGLNLTYYGIFVATANALATALFLVLAEAAGVATGQALAAVVATFVVCLPAARLVARLVEKKANTFTVSGASSAGLVALPWILLGIDALDPRGASIVFPCLAAVGVAYALGEGVGRLGCISFGCCYGKPLAGCHPRLQKLFAHAHFVFAGETKKVAYEGGLHGERVLPVQALTAVVCVATALVGAALFLTAAYGAAFFVCVAVTQAWRLASEALRSDHRGGGRISVYQFLSVLMVCYAGATVLLVPGGESGAPDILTGLGALWRPAPILFLQGLWVVIFLYMGRSTVTAATISLRVLTDRV